MASTNMGLMGCCCKKENGEERKSNRPREQSFYQQRLPAWQPLLNAGSVFPLFLVIGLVFVPLGAYMFVVSQGVFEHDIPYTHCSDGKDKCSSTISRSALLNTHKTCNCTKTFELKDDVKGEIFMYYGLTNFFQNHRRYVKSRDDSQLNGEAVMSPSSDCTPYRFYENTSIPYAPCGAVANSLFNDSFTLFYQNSTGPLTLVKLLKTGIAWKTDVDRKFGTPPKSYWSKTKKPLNWKLPAYNRSANPYQDDEDFIVWMRTAALPNFRKLYRRIDHSVEPFKDGLPKGNYTVRIDYAYPVTGFGGTKRIILSTTSWMGGKNNSLGISYMVVGSIHIILAIAFIIIDVKTRKRILTDDFEETAACYEVTGQNPQTSGINNQSDQRV